MTTKTEALKLASQALQDHLEMFKSVHGLLLELKNPQFCKLRDDAESAIAVIDAALAEPTHQPTNREDAEAGNLNAIRHIAYAEGYADGKAFREPEGWRPIETAPRDGTPILGLCQHSADPYYEGDRLTDYGARVEGLSHVEDGPHVLVWSESYDVSDGWDNPSFTIPDGWDLSHDPEVGANPTHWMPIPEFQSPPKE